MNPRPRWALGASLAAERLCVHADTHTLTSVWVWKVSTIRDQQAENYRWHRHVLEYSPTGDVACVAKNSALHCRDYIAGVTLSDLTHTHTLSLSLSLSRCFLLSLGSTPAIFCTTFGEFGVSVPNRRGHRCDLCLNKCKRIWVELRRVY